MNKLTTNKLTTYCVLLVGTLWLVCCPVQAAATAPTATAPQPAPQQPGAVSPTTAVPPTPADTAPATAAPATAAPAAMRPAATPPAATRPAAENSEDISAYTAVMKEAEAALERKDYNAARRLLETPARAGETEAEDLLGHMLLFGRGGAIDTRRAAALLQKAAYKGRLEARNSLGIIYMTGLAGELNPHTGVAWFKVAAEAGHSGAQFNLARAYEQGIGVDKSTEQAREWYTRAATQNNDMAKKHLEEMQQVDRLATLAPEQQTLRGQRSYAGESVLEARRRDASKALYDDPPRPRNRPTRPGHVRADNAPPPDPAKGAMFASAPEQMGTAASLSLRNLTLQRNARNDKELLASFALHALQSSTTDISLAGILSFVLRLADGTPVPLSVEKPEFSLRQFVDKNYQLTLPNLPTDGARLEISAVADGKVLASGQIPLPPVRSVAAAPAVPSAPSGHAAQSGSVQAGAAASRPAAAQTPPRRAAPAGRTGRGSPDGPDRPSGSETPETRRQRLIERILD